MTKNKFISRCITLAEHGLGAVAPNPMVGCVIVHEDRIIGEGFHREFGKAHAEAHAIESVADKELLKNSTLYVNLEPCNHHGKTPPCTELIISSGIKNVVVGSMDPNPLVSGKGIRRLEEAGIHVRTNVLEKECNFLNRRFFTFHQEKRPYIILKWAQTADGFMDRVRRPGETGMNWITGKESQRLVHWWRAQESAVLVGARTVINDDPRLTVRHVAGKNPLRVVLDVNLETNKTHRVYSDEAETIVYTRAEGSGIKDSTSKTDQVSIDPFKNYLEEVIKDIYDRNILSVIVEGGSNTISGFLNAGLWDEARVFTGANYFGEGLRAPEINQIPVETISVGDDRLSVFFQNR